MAKMLSLKIDVTKIDKSKLFVGKKGTYLDLTVAINDATDDYGNDVSAWQAQTKEERDAKTNRNFLGNGKVFWSNDGQQPAPPRPVNQPSTQHQAGDDMLPF